MKRMLIAWIILHTQFYLPVPELLEYTVYAFVTFILKDFELFSFHKCKAFYSLAVSHTLPSNVTLKWVRDG